MAKKSENREKIGESRKNRRIAKKSGNREKIGESRKNRRIANKFQQVFKMAENAEKQGFTFFAFLPPYIDVSGFLAYPKGKNFSRSIDWYRKFFISCLLARHRKFFISFGVEKQLFLDHRPGSVATMATLANRVGVNKPCRSEQTA